MGKATKRKELLLEALGPGLVVSQGLPKMVFLRRWCKGIQDLVILPKFFLGVNGIYLEAFWGLLFF